MVLKSLIKSRPSPPSLSNPIQPRAWTCQWVIQAEPSVIGWPPALTVLILMPTEGLFEVGVSRLPSEDGFQAPSIPASKSGSVIPHAIYAHLLDSVYRRIPLRGSHCPLRSIISRTKDAHPLLRCGNPPIWSRAVCAWRKEACRPPAPAAVSPDRPRTHDVDGVPPQTEQPGQPNQLFVRISGSSSTIRTPKSSQKDACFSAFLPGSREYLPWPDFSAWGNHVTVNYQAGHPVMRRQSAAAYFWRLKFMRPARARLRTPYE